MTLNIKCNFCNGDHWTFKCPDMTKFHGSATPKEEFRIIPPSELPKPVEEPINYEERLQVLMRGVVRASEKGQKYYLFNTDIGEENKKKLENVGYTIRPDRFYGHNDPGIQYRISWK